MVQWDHRETLCATEVIVKWLFCTKPRLRNTLEVTGFLDISFGSRQSLKAGKGKSHRETYDLEFLVSKENSPVGLPAEASGFS